MAGYFLLDGVDLAVPVCPELQSDTLAHAQAAAQVIVNGLNRSAYLVPRGGAAPFTLYSVTAAQTGITY